MSTSPASAVPPVRTVGPDVLRGLPVTLEDVREARRLLDGVARVTPVEGSRPLSDRFGGRAVLKCENLQRTGSFKLRGAYSRIARLDEGERARGVVAASAGNHAQGVALSAALLGVASTVFMPRGAPIPKVEATRAYGAQVRLEGETVEEALVAANAFAEQHGALLVHPFDDRYVVAGQGTVGLELLEQVPDLGTVVVPLGGGGLLAGIAVVVKTLAPHVRVIGVQAEGAAPWSTSLHEGRPVHVPPGDTLADGIAVGRPGGDITFPIVEQLVDEVVTVSEEGLSRGLLVCLERAKLVVEPAGAAGVAAVIEGHVRGDAPVALVLSGGNVDALVLQRVLRHGMAAAGRYLALRVLLGDRPGALAGVLEAIAEVDANVVEIEHARTEPGLAIGEVVIAVQLETRGSEHRDQVVDALDRAGYTVLARSDRPATT